MKSIAIFLFLSLKAGAWGFNATKLPSEKYDLWVKAWDSYVHLAAENEVRNQKFLDDILQNGYEYDEDTKQLIKDLNGMPHYRRLTITPMSSYFARGDCLYFFIADAGKNPCKDNITFKKYVEKTHRLASYIKCSVIFYTNERIIDGVARHFLRYSSMGLVETENFSKFTEKFPDNCPVKTYL